MTLPNLSKQALLSAEELRKRVSYDPETGIMRWQESRFQSRIGKPIGSRDARPGVNFKEGRFLLSRLAWLHFYGEWPGDQLDHINCDPSDNRIANLREATPLQNIANRRAQKGRRLKGITFYRGKWQAQIRDRGKTKFLGSFDTPEEAHEAYAARAVQLHGEFARLS